MSEPRQPSPMLTLARRDVDALLYALDDADGLFNGGERSERLLAMWQRLHHACCYLDAAGGVHGTPETRSLTISDVEALDLWLHCSPDWLRTVRPRSVQHHMTAILNRCRPSTRIRAYAV